MGRVVGVFPNLVAVIERLAERPQSCQVIVRSTGEWIVPIEGSGNRIPCIELCGFAGDQPVDFVFSLGDGVELPTLARTRFRRSSSTRDFMLKEWRELIGLGRKAAVYLGSDGVMTLGQPSEKLLQSLEARKLLSLRRGGLSLGLSCLGMSLSLSRRCLSLGICLQTLFFLCLTSGFYGALSGPLLFFVGSAKPA